MEEGAWYKRSLSIEELAQVKTGKDMPNIYPVSLSRLWVTLNHKEKRTGVSKLKTIGKMFKDYRKESLRHGTQYSISYDMARKFILTDKHFNQRKRARASVPLKGKGQVHKPKYSGNELRTLERMDLERLWATLGKSYKQDAVDRLKRKGVAHEKVGVDYSLSRDAVLQFLDSKNPGEREVMEQMGK